MKQLSTVFVLVVMAFLASSVKSFVMADEQDQARDAIGLLVMEIDYAGTQYENVSNLHQSGGAQRLDLLGYSIPANAKMTKEDYATFAQLLMDADLNLWNMGQVNDIVLSDITDIHWAKDDAQASYDKGDWNASLGSSSTGQNIFLGLGNKLTLSQSYYGNAAKQMIDAATLLDKYNLRAEMPPP